MLLADVVPMMRALLVLALTGCGGVCTPDALESALAAAGPGDVVAVGSCRIEGAFVVPDGVALEGDGPASVLASVEGGEPVVRTTTESRVMLRDLRIEVDHGGVGVRAAGGGTLAASGLTVVVTRGLGVGLAGCSAELGPLELTGPVTRENALFTPSDPAETGAYGIVGRDLGTSTVMLHDVHLSGFAVAAATFGGGSITWEGRADGPDVEASRGVGMGFFGSTGILRSIEIVDTLSGPRDVGTDILAMNAGDLVIDGLTLIGGEGFGVFAEDTPVRLTSARITNLGLSGVRVQGGSLEATDLVARGNGGAGVLAIDTTSVVLTDVELTDQRELPLPSTGVTTVLCGDGVQVVRVPESDGPPLAVTLRRVSLSGNERTGILLDAADGPVGAVEVEAVTVDAPTGATGAIAQRTALAPTWDGGITRTGGALNDDAFTGILDPVGIMMPPGSAPPSF